MVDVDLGRGVEVEVPDECTVGQWKRMLGDGFLGDKILPLGEMLFSSLSLGTQIF